MPVRKNFLIDTCGECCVYHNTEGTNPPFTHGRCRLNPPQPINAYTSAYPVVRKDNPACFAGQAGSKPKPKGKQK